MNTIDNIKRHLTPNVLIGVFVLSILVFLMVAPIVGPDSYVFTGLLVVPVFCSQYLSHGFRGERMAHG